MSAIVRNYLGYLRDCARLASRDSPIDFFQKSFRGRNGLYLLNSMEIRQVESTQSFQTDSPDLLRWRREFEISAEGECTILFGFMLTVGKHLNAKMCCPLVIAEALVSTEGENETRFEINQGTLRIYDTAISSLLTDPDNADPEQVTSEIEKISQEVPKKFPFGTKHEKLIRSIRNSLREDFREPFSRRVESFKSLDQADLRVARDSAKLNLFQTVALLKADALPDFTVEKELNEILRNEDAAETAVGTLVRTVGGKQKGPRANGDEETIDFDTSEVLEVLTLSEEQRRAVAFAKESRLTVISGPPGTGKSHTIASLAINLAYANKTVLITSKTREAVSVVVEKLSALGGRYVVAHVGDKSQKKEFAALIKGILEYESLDRRQEEKSVNDALVELEKIRKEKREIARAIRQLEVFYAQFHTSQAELDKLPDVPIPESLPSLSQLDQLKSNAAWVTRALSRPMPSFPDKLRSRVLLNQISKALNISVASEYRRTIQTVRKAFHKRKSDTARATLQKQKSIRTLWTNHADVVAAEQKVSGRVFERWRRMAIAGLLYMDRDNTPRLRSYANALEAPLTTVAKARVVSKILEGIDSSLLLSCFPIWAGTSSHLSQALKLEPGLFDYVIIDEASLCDPATAIPALYRAKRVIVVGDEKQLKHRSQNIAEAKLQMLASNNKLDAIAVNDLNYKKSVYEIAASRVSKSGLFMLDEHFRSLPPIIAFSNSKYYESRLKIMRRNPVNEVALTVEFRFVSGVRNEYNVIPEEFEEALSIARELLKKRPRVSFGVITMTEDQAKYMNARFAEDPDVGKMINHGKFKCGTPQSFQGDQRHTIILALGVDSQAHQRSLQHVLDDNRFNVAVTRAEDQMYVISSVSLSDMTGNLREYYEFSQGAREIPESSTRESFDSNFEREVYETLSAEGLVVLPQYESCGYFIDFVVVKGERFIGIEVDGPHHFDGQGNYVSRDVERSLRLTRGGWHIERISCYEWERGLPARRDFVKRVLASVNSK